MGFFNNMMDYLFNIFLVLGLLGLSAFFSASETAVTAASMARMVALANNRRSDGKDARRQQARARRAVVAVKLLSNKERLITIMLFCNNMVNIFASAYFTFLMTQLYGAKGLAIATIGVTVVVVLFGEVLPKSLAVYAADRIMLTLAYPLWVVAIITRPITFLIEGANRGVMKLLRLQHNRSDDRDDELRGVIHMQEETSVADRQEKLMLQSVLDLADNALDSAMTHRQAVEMVSTRWSQKKIIDKLLTAPYSYVPAYDDDPDVIVGVFHIKSLLRKTMVQQLTKKQLLAVMVKPWFVPVSTTLAHQLQAFRQTGRHFAILVDEYGVFKGVVTLEDIVSEIVGEIEDVHRNKKEDMMKTRDGAVVALGSVTVRNLNRAYNWDLPEEGINTIAGLVLRAAKIVPPVGTGVTAEGFHFVVLEASKQQIKKIKIRKLPAKVGRISIHGMQGRDRRAEDKRSEGSDGKQATDKLRQKGQDKNRERGKRADHGNGMQARKQPVRQLRARLASLPIISYFL